MRYLLSGLAGVMVLCAAVLAADKKSGDQQPNIEFFTQVKLPQYVARPHEKGAYGASKLTPQGIQPIANR
jgi:hypothetical protein